MPVVVTVTHSLHSLPLHLQLLLHLRLSNLPGISPPVRERTSFLQLTPEPMDTRYPKSSLLFPASPSIQAMAEPQLAIARHSILIVVVWRSKSWLSLSLYKVLCDFILPCQSIDCDCSSPCLLGVCRSCNPPRNRSRSSTSHFPSSLLTIYGG